MSFKPDISAVSIANQSLALLPEDPISNIDEDSLAAREIRRSYKDVVAEMLEAYHWNLATKRASLAQVTNVRSGEWGFAYAKPSDMAYPVQLTTMDGGVWGGWFMQDHAFMIAGGRKLFMQVGNTLYSSVPMATLEYTSFDVTEADFTALFKEIVVLELAARICPPITKDMDHANKLTGKAEWKKQRAIASDLNRNRQTYGHTPTESEIVRMGGGGTGSGGYALDPVANPAYGIISSLASNTGY